MFAIGAAVAAFDKGEDWLEELRVYLRDNKQLVRDFIREKIPQIKVVPSQATYLLWLDCSQMTENATKVVFILRRERNTEPVAGSLSV